ncbi:hypothetical protein [Rhodococcus sp. UNC363MFTsu5.1]|uniref:hypothetical protein n=1 Tax=Rhodococcus sp. UNC363MFTsu5.1 TaxID=1449069 RepID=UPI0012DC567A|nr:hypothetical protein [Rhodococcus sp. UNC363MFTsu5.1]
MRGLMVAAAGIVAIGLGTVLAPTAAAVGGPGEYSRCESFRAPWDPQAWIRDGASDKIVLSPFGAGEVYCTSWHGMTGGYQVDPWGNKHWLDTPWLGPLTNKIYVWNPETF